MSRRGRTFLMEAVSDAIDYTRKEFKMTYVEIIGCLECIKHEMLVELDEDEDEDEDSNFTSTE